MKKIFWFIFSSIIMLIPTWIFIALWKLLKPSTFWQKFSAVILGNLLLGFIQIVLFGAWIVFLIAMFEQIDSEKQRKLRIKEHLKTIREITKESL